MTTDPKAPGYPSQVQSDPMPRREDTGLQPPKPGEEHMWPPQGDEAEHREEVDKQVPEPDQPTPLSDERR
ncbi:hypothetical protein D3C76_1141660 [compost metagenome]